MKHHSPLFCFTPPHTFPSLQLFPVCEQAKQDPFHAPVLPHACLTALSQSLLSENMIVIKVSNKNWKLTFHTALLWVAFGMRGIASLLRDLRGSSQDYLDTVGGVTIFSQTLQQVSSFFQKLPVSSLPLLTHRRVLWNWPQKAETDVGCRHMIHTQTFLTLLHFSSQFFKLQQNDRFDLEGGMHMEFYQIICSYEFLELNLCYLIWWFCDHQL